jgi:DNA topoisomerase-6 subunit B
MAAKKTSQPAARPRPSKSVGSKADQSAAPLFDLAAKAAGKPHLARHPSPPEEIEPKQASLREAQPQEPVATGAPDDSSPQSKITNQKSRIGHATAETMAKAQRSISVSEFFAKNRHLLGFDNPRKALLTTVKEAVDNSLDACEEAGILPVVEITIEQLSETQFKVTVQDNGPGIVRQQIPHIFGRLLYGSKFHRLRMSRGQQGIGISAAGMYGLLTTGRPVQITSRTGPRSPAHYYELQIDTRQNKPDVMRDTTVEWDAPHGTKVTIELEAKYQKGRQSVDDYLQQTAIANPHVTLVYHSPDGRSDQYKPTTSHSPPVPKEIRPHPAGVELGVLIKMLADTKAHTVQQFLTKEFSRVSPRVAGEILTKAGIEPRARPSRLTGEAAKPIYQAIQQTKIMAPSSDCVVPIGEEHLEQALRQVVKADFYTACSRSPSVYRGNPFIIEVALAYGRPPVIEPTEDESVGRALPAKGEGDGANVGRAGSAPKGQVLPDGNALFADSSTSDETAEPDQPQQPQAASDEPTQARLIRFANRVPLLYQQSACSIYKSVVSLNWKSYGLSQPRGALPMGDLTVVVHMASVWVPFTSESKEAIAAYPEILKELRLALQECGRRLGAHVRKGIRMNQELKKRSYIEKYIPAIGEALRDILDLGEKDVSKVCDNLKHVLERSRKF